MMSDIPWHIILNRFIMKQNQQNIKHPFSTSWDTLHKPEKTVESLRLVYLLYICDEPPEFDSMVLKKCKQRKAVIKKPGNDLLSHKLYKHYHWQRSV